MNSAGPSTLPPRPTKAPPSSAPLSSPTPPAPRLLTPTAADSVRPSLPINETSLASTAPRLPSARMSSMPPRPAPGATAGPCTPPPLPQRHSGIDPEVVQLLARVAVEEALSPVLGALREIARRLDNVEQRQRPPSVFSPPAIQAFGSSPSAAFTEPPVLSARPASTLPSDRGPAPDVTPPSGIAALSPTPALDAPWNGDRRRRRMLLGVSASALITLGSLLAAMSCSYVAH